MGIRLRVPAVRAPASCQRRCLLARAVQAGEGPSSSPAPWPRMTWLSSSWHEVRLWIDAAGDGSGRCALVAEIAGVASPAALGLEACAERLRLGGHELPLPSRIDVETSQVRWSRRRQVATFTATCMAAPGACGL
mmetsp:Transcript_119583/g.333687  ORF Transcript_119583/g.333687 Transcript_119583/m.333687 type:complete len:135 (+) Transcript_119583:571-975(+)